MGWKVIDKLPRRMRGIEACWLMRDGGLSLTPEATLQLLEEGQEQRLCALAVDSERGLAGFRPEAGGGQGFEPSTGMLLHRRARGTSVIALRPAVSSLPERTALLMIPVPLAVRVALGEDGWWSVHVRMTIDEWHRRNELPHRTLTSDPDEVQEQLQRDIADGYVTAMLRQERDLRQGLMIREAQRLEKKGAPE